MSIFKSTLNPTIAAQLKAREKVVSTTSTRDSDFLQYTTGKNSWVRMTSFVNYDSKKLSNGEFINDEKYTGDALSKKYVLEGGTLYNQGKGLYSLRAGVGNVDGIYASNIDKIEANPSSNKVDRMYGLRPMPGITNASVTNRSAYGSLREATIQFYAWDKHQLEELEILFMRTGYTVFLEWGWSEYIDHDVPSKINDYPNLKTPAVKDFNTLTLNPFQVGLTDDIIYNKIDKDVINNKGNYDALLGFVKNFTWQLMPNGGFQCSTTLISRGEVIDSIKTSSNPNIILGSDTSTPEENKNKPALSNFEQIFLSIIGHINEAEYSKSYSFDSGTTSTPGSFVTEDITDENLKILRESARVEYDKIKEKLKVGQYKYISGSWDNYTIGVGSNMDLDKETALKFCDGKEQGVGIEYISMNAFIAILNEFFIFKNEKTNNNAVQLILPYSTPCLASEDSVSIDPTTCLIQNVQATLITDTLLGLGFSPDIFSSLSKNETDDDSFTGGVGPYKLPEFLANSKTNIGQIGNIYISINKIINMYRSKSGDGDGVDLVPFLQELLNAISFSLGGINDFKLFTERNIVQIIDVKYFENVKKETKFEFDLIGLKSICRDVKISSRIFDSQATMIGIGAGTSANRNNNLGDIYSSTQAYFNRGLEDRIMSTTFDSTDITVTDEEYFIKVFKNIESLTSYINKKVTGFTNIKGSSKYQVTIVPQQNEIINAGSLLKTFHYQINGKDVNFKALIPFELEITLDGIGGLVIGQIFRVNKSILPKDYVNKNLGFVITGVSHSLQNNDWTTTIKTQICLLDNDDIKERSIIDRTNLRAGIIKGRENQAQNGYLLCALADYMVDQYINAVDEGKGQLSKTLIDFLSDDPSQIYSNEKNWPYLRLLTNYDASEESIRTYLKTWYDDTLKAYPLLSNSLPNFPRSFEEFVKPKGPNTASNFDTLLTNFSNFLLGKKNSNDAGLEIKRLALVANPPLTSSQREEIWKLTYFGQIETSNPGQKFPIEYTFEEQEAIDNSLAEKRTILNDIRFYKTSVIISEILDKKPEITLRSLADDLVNRLTNPSALLSQEKQQFVLNYYKLRSDSFYEIFTIFYSYLQQSGNIIGLGEYGAPKIDSNTSFKITHRETPL